MIAWIGISFGVVVIIGVILVMTGVILVIFIKRRNSRTQLSDSYDLLQEVVNLKEIHISKYEIHISKCEIQ